MTPARAAEVLRGECAITPMERTVAETMGADALEFQSWLFALLPNFDGYRVGRLYKDWHGEDSFLAYCRAEWEKEKERNG